MTYKKSNKVSASLQGIKPKDREVFLTIERYMSLLNHEDASIMNANMLIILSSEDDAIKHELYEIARRVREKQWEDEDRSFKKNIFMIIEALVEDA